MADTAPGHGGPPAIAIPSPDGPSADPMYGMGSQIIENIGQAGEAGGAFYLQTKGASIFFRADRITVVLGDPAAAGGVRPCAYDVVFEGANHVTPKGIDPTGTTYNFFMGDDPSRWSTGARGFAGARYAGLWDCIDLVYRMDGGSLKYDLIAAPGADVSSARFSYVGVEGLSLDGRTGALSVRLQGGVCGDDAPVSFQEAPQGRIPVDSRFSLAGLRTVGFEVGAYDASRPLVIDPMLLFSTYLGTADIDIAEDCCVGPDGTLYVFGVTTSFSFPTLPDDYKTHTMGGYEIFVSRLSSNGTTLLDSTYVGGSDNENGPYGSTPQYFATYGGMCVDGSGNVLVTGQTLSNNFPTTVGAYDRSYSTGAYDCIVLKLSANLSELMFSTYLGGSKGDYAVDICVDSHDNPIVAGATLGGFPVTAGAFDTTFNGTYDGFVAKLNASGDRLLNASYIGGGSDDFAYAVAVDSEDMIYLSGYTGPSGFPTTSGAFDTTPNGGWDAYLLKLDGTAASAEYSTLLGGSEGDYGLDLAVDDQGRAYVLGATGGFFPTVAGCYDVSGKGRDDIFISRLSANGSVLEESTFFGSTESERAFGLALAPDGDVAVGGFTEWKVPTTPDAYNSTNKGHEDAFVAWFDPDLTTLEYCSMFGSPGIDRTWGLSVNPLDRTVYIVGDTWDSRFPTTVGAYDTTYHGGPDTFIVKVGEAHPPSWLPLPGFSAVEDVPLTIDLSGYVTDARTPLGNLSISTVSESVSSISGLNVTVLFPNGVTEAIVPITVFDGEFRATADLNFTIAPVNDPPTCDIWTDHTATEDVPLLIDFSPNVSDVDDPLSELSLVVDSPYANASGLNLTMLFPERVTSYELYLNLSDGTDNTTVHLLFTVIPVDDPPVVAQLPLVVVREDQDGSFNLTPYLSDPDTPVDRLGVVVRDRNCTVAGQVLTFRYDRGSLELDVPLEVSDEHSSTAVVLHVRVDEVDDPPVAREVPPLVLTEDNASTVDLSAYVSDEDTPLDRLVLECADPHVVEPIEGLNLTLLFTVWEPEKTINFNFFDGTSRCNGSLIVQVRAVNDAPVILGLGDLAPPYAIAIDEGSAVYLAVRVSDEDDTLFGYDIASTWGGIVAFKNGTVRVDAAPGEVGNYTAILTVDDRKGGTATAAISIRVLNVNDPPAVPTLVLPLNHTLVEEGTNVTFSAKVTDPDIPFGQMLTVTWASNISGPLKTLPSTDDLAFTIDDLPVGIHRISVAVTDGEYTREAWFELTVKAKHVPPPPGPPTTQPPSQGGFDLVPIIALVVALLCVGAVVAILVLRRRSAGGQPPAGGTV